MNRDLVTFTLVFLSTMSVIIFKLFNNSNSIFQSKKFFSSYLGTVGGLQSRSLLFFLSLSSISLGDRISELFCFHFCKDCKLEQQSVPQFYFCILLNLMIKVVYLFLTDTVELETRVKLDISFTSVPLQLSKFTDLTQYTGYIRYQLFTRANDNWF